MAPTRTASCTQCNLPPPGSSATRLRAFTTGAASLATDNQGTNPVSTTATPIYRIVQISSVARIPIGTSRFGALHSSLAVETESKPMYVKKMIDPPANTPGHPFGENGV